MNNFVSKKQLIVLVLCLALSYLFVGCPDSTDPSPPTKKIAVFNGSGSWDISAAAVKNCLEDAGRSVEFVSEFDIQNSLDEFGVIIMPAGNPHDMISSLGYTGKQNIRLLVNEGGGYIGLGGGAYLAADSLNYNNSTILDSLLALYRGYASGPINQISPNSFALTNIVLNTEYFNPAQIPDIQTLYYGGPKMVITIPSDHIILATFSNLTEYTPAAVAFNYGFGRVVLSSVHPEIEENDDRDGSDWGNDSLVDGDSEWFWLQQMVEWVLWEIN